MMKFIVLACVGVLLVACGYSANNQLRVPKKETPPEGLFMDVNGTRVHYVSRGRGPDLILIHGAGGSSRDWTFSMMDKLVDHYRVIAIDRPGHGYTDRIKTREDAGETLKEQADLIASVAQTLDVKNAVVAGQSYGGGVAMALAVHHPDMLAGLTIISGVSNPWTGDLDDWYQTTNTFWGKHFLIPVISTLTTRAKAIDVAMGIFEPDPMPEGYVDHMGVKLSSRASQIRANTEQIHRSLGDVKAMVGQYHTVTVPTEIIHGDQDTTVPLDVHAVPLSRQIAGSRLTVLKGAGHMPHHSREADVIAAINRTAKRAGLR